jgi:hypothetical protein
MVKLLVMYQIYIKSWDIILKLREDLFRPFKFLRKIKPKIK